MAKVSPVEKKLRREIEVLRAQLKESTFAPSRVVVDLPVNPAKVVDSLQAKRLTLPIKEIQKDLIKTGIYVAFSIAVLVVLKLNPILATASLALFQRQ